MAAGGGLVHRHELLAFGTDGCGDRFCPWRRGPTSVVCWYPVDDEVHALANSLPRFFTGWWNGSIATWIGCREEG